MIAEQGAGNDCETVDKLSPQLRSIVHEYGLSVVRAYLECGVSSPKRIRHLIHQTYLGAREVSNRPRICGASRLLQQLDDILIKLGAGPSGKMLIRELWAADFVLIQHQPSAMMIDASLSALDNVGSVTKHRKHELRLISAINATVKSMWPWLSE